MSELRYALKDNKLICITEVNSGLSCNCYCPECKARLIAKKGQKKEHHFAHYKVADCGKGRETALHLLAKSIIKNNKRVCLKNYETNKYNIYQFQNAEEEVQINPSIRSDVLLTNNNGKRLNVEILVTHEVDYEKQIKLFNCNLSTIEIDLSSFIDKYDEEIIEKAILSDKYTKWIYNEKYRNGYLEFMFSYPIHRNMIRYTICPKTNKIVHYDGFLYDCYHDCLDYNMDNDRCCYQYKLIPKDIDGIKSITRDKGFIIKAVFVKNGNDIEVNFE